MWPPEKRSTSEFLEPVNVASRGQRDFADRIQLRILRWEVILHYPVGPTTRGLMKGGRRVQVRNGNVMGGADREVGRCNTADSEAGEGGCEPGNASGL